MSYAVYRMLTPKPQTTPISTHCVAFHTFIEGEDRDFKFGVQVDHSKSQPSASTCARLLEESSKIWDQ